MKSNLSICSLRLTNSSMLHAQAHANYRNFLQLPVIEVEFLCVICVVDVCEKSHDLCVCCWVDCHCIRVISDWPNVIVDCQYVFVTAYVSNHRSIPEQEVVLCCNNFNFLRGIDLCDRSSLFNHRAISSRHCGYLNGVLFHFCQFFEWRIIVRMKTHQNGIAVDASWKFR